MIDPVRVREYGMVLLVDMGVSIPEYGQACSDFLLEWWVLGSWTEDGELCYSDEGVMKSWICPLGWKHAVQIRRMSVHSFPRSVVSKENSRGMEKIPGGCL